MATAVLDLEITRLPAEVTGLERYSKAFMLFRYKSRPVGRIILEVEKGCLKISEHLPQITRAIGHALYKVEVNDFLEWDIRKVPHYTPPMATVAVCTRDRPEDLRRCLDALMQLPDRGQEYLVIDNCPATNATLELVAAYPRVRYVQEKRAGLNIARNRAIKEASHEIVLFTDDDATPDQGWLDALLLNFSHPLVQCVTGLVMPLELETEAQETFENFTPFQRGFERRVHTLRTVNPLATGRVGAGASMAIRKSVCQEVGYFDEALDAGTPTRSGGDHDFFSRILTAGFTIVYDPAALSWHRHRRSFKELESTLFGYGVGVYAVFTRHLLQNREWSVVRIAFNWFWYSQLRQLVKAILRRSNTIPASLVLAELKGCLAGPWAYLKSRKRLHKQYH